MNDDLSQVPPKSAVVKQALSSDNNVRNFLLRMINVNEAGVFHDPKCPVCCSCIREKAEDEWLTNRNAKEVKKLLKDAGESVTIPFIKNHMEGHVDKGQVEIRKREYIDRVLSIHGENLSTLDRLQISIDTLDERLIAVNASDDPSLSPAQLEKTKAETTCKLVSAMQSLLQLRASLLGELGGNGDIFAIKKDDFERVFGEVFNEFDGSNDVNAALSALLDKLINVKRLY